MDQMRLSRRRAQMRRWSLLGLMRTLLVAARSDILPRDA